MAQARFVVLLIVPFYQPIVFADVCEEIGFSTARSFEAGEPRSAVAGDFNSDGKRDLAVVNAGGVTVFLGNGDGTFHPSPNNYKTGDAPLAIATADFNGDGKADLVVVNNGILPDSFFGGEYHPGSISVLLGNGDGSFKQVANYWSGGSSAALDISDLNGDGKSDIIVASFGNAYERGTVLIFLGNGDGTFKYSYLQNDFFRTWNPQAIVAGDVDGDGIPDLAVANLWANLVAIFIGKGDGTFRDQVDYGVGNTPHALAFSDLHSTGKLDLLVANLENVSIMHNKGNGTFQVTNVDVGAHPDFLKTGDLNRDGKPDLAALTDLTVSVLLGTGNDEFKDQVNYGLGSYGQMLVVDDFDDDGKSDLIVADSHNLEVFLGKGDGFFQKPDEYQAGSSPRSIVVADFNHDGELDLAVANAFSSDVSVLFGNSDGTFQPAVSYLTGSGPFSVAIGDFNRDGNLDLVTANYFGGVRGGNGSISVLLGKADGTFVPPVEYLAGSNNMYSGVAALGFVSVSDFNQDGKPDVIASSYFGPGSFVFLSNGDGTFQPPLRQANYQQGHSPITGDFNGDGKIDLIVPNFVEGTISVSLGRGRRRFEKVSDFVAGYRISAVAVGDFNQDGRLDLVASSEIGGIKVLFNTCGLAKQNVRLDIANKNQSAIISWPFTTAGFVLESTTNLLQTNWSRASEAPSTNGSRLEISTPLASPQRFFRLRKP